MSDDEIIKEEIEAILSDIRELYNNSGKRVSGDFEKELEAVYEPNKATIRGVKYLAGRPAGKQPPTENLKSWVEARGIHNKVEPDSAIAKLGKEQRIRSLAFLIARKIAKEGTSKKNALKIYEEVITPQRINSIIDRVSKVNVDRLVTDLRIEIEILAKNV